MPTELEARALISENMDHNPDFVRCYWFPDPNEYRLVYVDPTLLPAEPGHPVEVFQMTHDEGGKIIPLKVGFVKEEEAEVLPLPDWWGQNWDNAVQVRRRAA